MMTDFEKLLDLLKIEYSFSDDTYSLSSKAAKILMSYIENLEAVLDNVLEELSGEAF